MVNRGNVSASTSFVEEAFLVGFLSATVAHQVFGASEHGLCNVADQQKSAAKKLAPGRFVDTGLYRIVRCPNYFGEVIFWTGILVSGLGAMDAWWQWLMALTGYVAIVYIMFSGARRLELRQDHNYGEDPEYQVYKRSTPILLPFIPIYSVKRHKWLRG